MTPEINEASPVRRSRVLDEVLLSLNAAGALFLCGLVYTVKNSDASIPVNDSTYLCLRSAYRIVDFLGLQSVSPVATSAVRRQLASASERLGIELLVILTVLGAAAAIVLQLRLLSHTPIYRVILGSAALILALFAAPACYVYASLTWNWGRQWASPHGNFFRQSFSLVVFLAEVLCLCLLLVWFRRRGMPRWVMTLFVALHYVFWIFVAWSETPISMFPIYSLDLILLVFPVAAFVYVWQGRSLLRRFQEISEGRTTEWTWVLAPSVLLVAGVVWSPARNIELSHPRDLNSIKVELSRGPCFGRCPVYTVTVYGDGRVEYVGQRGSRIQTKKTGMVAREQVAQILKMLKMLDQVNFMALDGRAFFWAFDTPTVGVRASVDGKTKQVASDADYVGSPTGRQARFVQATREIDAILTAAIWSKCEGECGNSSR